MKQLNHLNLTRFQCSENALLIFLWSLLFLHGQEVILVSLVIRCLLTVNKCIYLFFIKKKPQYMKNYIKKYVVT